MAIWIKQFYMDKTIVMAIKQFNGDMDKTIVMAIWIKQF